MTEHRCTNDRWEKGKTKHCPKCAANRKPRSVKQSGES